MSSDAPLRIALLTYRGKPHVGGQGVYTRHLAKALVDLGRGPGLQGHADIGVHQATFRWAVQVGQTTRPPGPGTTRAPMRRSRVRSPPGVAARP